MAALRNGKPISEKDFNEINEIQDDVARAKMRDAGRCTQRLRREISESNSGMQHGVSKHRGVGVHYR